MDIDSSEAEKLSELNIDFVSSEGDVMKYKVKSDGEYETEFELPRYDVFLGWIEIFGLPPFNEWVLLRDFDSLEKQFSGQLNGERYRESVSIEKKGPAGTEIKLNRESGDIEERYSVREIEYSKSATSGGLAIFDVQHSQGEYHARLERSVAENPGEIEELKKDLEEDEIAYLEKVIDEEGKPSVVVLKESVVDGKAPPVYQKLFPFWGKTRFNEDGVRSIELGYMESGDSESKVDQMHGDWYKLFTFEDFDYRQLEIREGNWKSTETDFQGKKVHTKKHYEKHLYRR